MSDKGSLSRWFDRKGWVMVLIGTPYVWLLVLFLVPFLIVVAMSVATRPRPRRRFPLAANTPGSTGSRSPGCSPTRCMSAPS